MNVSVVDLFAGPGGLGEGFSAFKTKKGKSPFKIKVSVEKDPDAYSTLLLRAFFRQFSGRAPDEYYEYVKSETNDPDRARGELFAAFPVHEKAARDETLGAPKELGKKKDDKILYQRLKELKKENYPLVVIGGPPCQAYSLVGRARNKGIEGYSPENDPRYFLYKHYYEVLAELNPHVFVMENVQGILSAEVGGKKIFPEILKKLKNPHTTKSGRDCKRYVIHSFVVPSPCEGAGIDYKDFTIRSEQYGIPQSRHRVILLGIREDLCIEPNQLRKKSAPAIHKVIGDCPKLRCGVSKLNGGIEVEVWKSAIYESVEKIKALSCKYNIDVAILDKAKHSLFKNISRGGRFIEQKNWRMPTDDIGEWYRDERLGGYLNHDTRGHMSGDICRYMFCTVFAKQHGRSPKATDFPCELAPNHKNWNSGKFIDRFKVQLKSKPSSTITSHISKDGHSYIHYDPAQCRSLTVREAARIQTFPDNYFFEGVRTQQYAQVGNAVPPLLAYQIAEIVHEVLNG